MKDQIRINNPEDGDKIMRLAMEREFLPSLETCIARLIDGQFAGGAVYTAYTRRSIQMHMAGKHPRWINRDMLWMCFDYPFNQLGVEKIFGCVSADNERALAIDKKFGFREEAIIKDVYPSGDMVVLGMYREDCRWLALDRSGIHG